MKIKFNQPKYILPLIVLPFTFIIAYLVDSNFAFGSEEELGVELKETDKFNTEIPEPHLDKRDVKDKFDAFKESYKYNQDFSAIQEIERNEELDSETINSGLTEEEKELIDSVNNEIITGKKKNFNDELNDYLDNNHRQVSNNHSYLNSGASANTSQLSEYEKEMQLFKEQMLFIDSLTKSEEEKKDVKSEKSIAEVKEKPKMDVSKYNPLTINHFNTITQEKHSKFIRAILDEGLTVYDGSRIRIRLLDNIFVGQHVIEKGKYLYGVISGFGKQRVKISIESILYEDQILPVDLVLFDNDGMEGLYVPESKFRDFTKDLASNTVSGQNLQIETDDENTNQFLIGLAQKAFQTTTRATSQAVRKNRAKLKYNTIVYLVNPDKIN
ncbi:conjugative transposon protein TraM [Chondrinema litorale]|uniref:conjugative transposon protein TraM n=1 Tax=Chondrinema litorale TaxID=2994555 RepID=UPI002542A9B3|nr:conjugative transposon protein TraM [Chondrinema litorale]UZR99615.1 conjugative transposon protein TraM [Chondrinema litorale]